MQLGEIEPHESGDCIYQKTPKSEAEAIYAIEHLQISVSDNRDLVTPL